MAAPARSGTPNAGSPRRDRPRTAHHLRAQRQVGLHHTRRHGKSRLGHVLHTAQTASSRPASPGPERQRASPRAGTGNDAMTTAKEAAEAARATRAVRATRADLANGMPVT